ncbi:MAG: GNAT family N-acetyltransferase [Rubrivivax sp.]
MFELCTPRLRLRHWRDADRAPFAALNADPDVMRYFPVLGTRDGSDRLIDAWQTQLRERGWSNWAVERLDTTEFIGFVGLTVPGRVLPFTPCVEVGWRLGRSHWHQGFATEAAQAALDFGWRTARLDEIVSFTALGNAASIAVMRRLGMQRDEGGDFDHPAVPQGSPLQRHCLYRIAAPPESVP